MIATCSQPCGYRPKKGVEGIQSKAQKLLCRLFHVATSDRMKPCKKHSSSIDKPPVRPVEGVADMITDQLIMARATCCSAAGIPGKGR